MSGGDRRKQRGRFARWSFLIGWIVFLAAIAFVFANWTDEREMLLLAERAEPAWLLVALLLQVVTYASAAAIWGVTLRRLGVTVAFKDLVALTFAKLFTDALFPTGGIVGSAVVARALNRRGVPGPKATTVILVNVLGTYPALGSSLGVAAFVLHEKGHLHDIVLSVAGAFGLITILIPGLLLHFSGPGEGATRRFLRRIPLARDLIKTMSEIPPADLRDPIALGCASLLEVTIIALDAATMIAILHALGVSVSAIAVLAAYAVAVVAGVVTILPGGFGGFDAVLIAILSTFGVKLESSLSALLLLRGIAQLLPMLPGWWLARREIAAEHSATIGP